MFSIKIFLPLLFVGFIFLGCNTSDVEEPTFSLRNFEAIDATSVAGGNARVISTAKKRYSGSDFYQKLSDAAISLTEDDVTYDGKYFSIGYPNGDVPADRGVCTDVVIRAYRLMGIDLQKEVHEDMRSNFSAYPNRWGLSRPDKNIDHRRVPNLMKYFQRQGAARSITSDGDDYRAGDVVSWNLSNGLTHIGIVVDKKSHDERRPLIVHNIGSGQVLADCLFDWEITGHYRYGK